MNKERKVTKLLNALPIHPKSYYRGITGRPLLPENIILFTRKKQTDLLSGSPSYAGSLHHRYVFIINWGIPIRVIVDHNIWDIDSNSSLVIFPFQFHRFLPSSAITGDIQALFITFEFNHRIINQSMEILRNRSIKITSDLSGQVIDFAREYQNQGLVGAKELLVLKLSMILTSLTQLSGKGEEGPFQPVHRDEKDKIIGVICKKIYENPSLTMEQLASQVSLSKGYVRSLFKAVLNRSLGEYILEIRISRARILLAGSDMTVGAVGEECGYPSLYSFSRMFKNRTGYSPSEYRRNSRGDFMIPASLS